MNSAILSFSSARFSVLVVLLALLLAGLPVVPTQAQDKQGDANQPSSAVQAIAHAINQQRANAGLPPLTLQPLLNLAAQNHVDDMIANHSYGHTGSDGSYVRQRVERVGYASGGWVSENWVSANDPAGAMRWWMSDWIHRANILNPHWREFGVGAGVDPSGGMIFVTDFTAGSGGGDIQIDNVSASAAVPEPLSIPADGIDYTIQPGDTLLAIAYRYGVDWVIIAEANKINGETLLQIGQVMHLPGVKGVGGLTKDKTAVSTDDQQTDNKKGTTPAPAATQETTTQTNTVSTTRSFTRLYTVQPGNTLVDIAQIYNITWQELAAANGLKEDSVLAIGEELRIPDKAQTTTTEATAVQTEAQPAETTDQTPRYHQVKPGETIITIAIHYGLDWHDLLRLNNLNEDSLLQPDQKIQLK